MIEVQEEDGTTVDLTAEMIRAQLELLVHDDVLRSSRRSVAFLRYVVEQTLNGAASQIKERTIGIEVFGRKPTYDTNVDHIVRTAATELRKRLAIYYGDEKHRNELRMGLIPGSYIPRFSPPEQAAEPDHPEPDPIPHLEPLPPPPAPPTHRIWPYLAIAILILATGLGYGWVHRTTAQDLFWKPVLDTPGPVLLAIGDVPNGPPKPPAQEGDTAEPVHRIAASRTVPFADAVTMARVVAALQSRGKQVIIRKESASSFSDLREGPVVLIGAFNNEWSLRLARQLRYSLAFDADRHLIYIRDAQNPAIRTWSWATNDPPGQVAGPHSPPIHDYALISRIRNSETGKVVVVIGGLYTFGTQSAGEFLSDPQLMQAITKAQALDPAHPNLQIVLGTTVTDETPGPPQVLAISAE